MATYITELAVSLTDAEEDKLTSGGFKKLYVNLNSIGKHAVYIWYKNGRNNPITRIQFSYTDSMAKGLKSSGFENVDRNLNTGSCGDKVFLWYFKGTTEDHVPITEIDVTRDDDPNKFTNDWERMSCNLDRHTKGFSAFLWVKREKQTYIQDMKVTNDYDDDEDYLKRGYIRVDESTNRNSSGKPVFLWYLPTTKKEGSYGSLQVSTSDPEYERYEKQGFRSVIPRVNLNEGNQGDKVYLLYKQDAGGQRPIKTIILFSNKELIKEYENANVTVLQKNLNSGDGSPCFPATPLYMGYYN